MYPEKLERNQEEACNAETVINRSSLDNMATTENNERNNANELSQEAVIGTMMIREELLNTIICYQFEGMIYLIRS